MAWLVSVASAGVAAPESQAVCEVRPPIRWAPSALARQGPLREVLRHKFPASYDATVPVLAPDPVGAVPSPGPIPVESRPLRCAVVGSSSNLLGSSYGREIDDHDVVVRINLAPTRNFEKDVGTRTTHYVVNQIARGALQEGWATLAGREEFDRTAEWLLREQGRAPSPVDFAPQAPTRALSAVFVEYVRMRWKSQADDERAPSSGLLGVMAALHACDTVDAYGFGADAKQVRGFYYKPRTYDGHSPEGEEALMRRLAAAGVLKVHGGPPPWCCCQSAP